MKLVAVVAVAVALLSAQTERAGRNAVTAVRHWSLTDATRVVIEVSGDFTFTWDRLHNPERVYFDISNSLPRLEKRRIYNEAIDDPLLRRIRVAETVPGKTRVVLDLSAPGEVTTSQLSTPNRLIVELRTAPAPAMAAEAPAISTTPSASPLPFAAKPMAPRMEAPSRPAAPPFLMEAPKVEPPKTILPKVDLGPPARPPARLNAKVEAPAPVLVPDLAPETAIAAPAVKIVEPGENPHAARHTASGQTSLVRALGLKVGRVVIDPGHGGHDEGTHGEHGLVEKDLVLDVAKRVGKLIEDRMGAEVIYTRSDDTFIPLEGRTALANEKKADLFLSIHANSSPYSKIAGTEVYYLNFPESKEAADVAARENASSQKSVFELRDIIQKITLHDKAEESKEFAGRVQTALYGFSAKNFPASRNRGVKKAPFVVLIGANMPSVLAEIGFLTNSREESLLKRSEYRQRLAEALYRGLSKYAESLSHFQVAQVQ